MLLTSMSSLSIVDKHLLKRLTKDVITSNLAYFNVNTLIIMLTVLDKLHMRNKRCQSKIYREVRGRYKELEESNV